MKIEKLCNQYDLSQEDIQELIRAGVITKELSDSDLKKIGTIMLFKESGLCCEQIIKYYSFDESKQGKSNKMRILRKLRETVLTGIHNKEKLLDNIDYILYELQQEK